MTNPNGKKMPKLGVLKLKGQSGAEYSFDVYPANTTWNDNVACVYYVSKRTIKADDGGDHKAIYIGETNDLKDRLANHHKQDCFDGHQYNAISTLHEANANQRTQIEADLIRGIRPPCNE